MEIKVLEVGCSKCKLLYDRTQQAVRELGLNEEVIDVSDLFEIMEYRVRSMPALVINGEVKCAGKVPKVETIKEWLKQS